jgi:hypothetical protein
LVFVKTERRLDQEPPNIGLHHDVRLTATTLAATTTAAAGLPAPPRHQLAPRRQGGRARLHRHHGVSGRLAAGAGVAAGRRHRRARRAPGHGPASDRRAWHPADPAGPREQAARARGRRVQVPVWQARRTARLAELGFTDLAGYLKRRYVEQGWSIRRIRAELRVGRRWLVAELARLGLPALTLDT